MASLEEIINLPLEFEDDEKKEFLANWLAKEYEIKVADERILLEFVAVHNHGDGQLHLGHPEISNSFGPGGAFQLVRLPDGWHVGFRPQNSPQVIIIHPKSETVSWETAFNKSTLAMASNLLKNGELKSEVTYYRPQHDFKIEPAALAPKVPTNTPEGQSPESTDHIVSKSPEFVMKPVDPLAGLGFQIDRAIQASETLAADIAMENSLEHTISMTDIKQATSSINIDMNSFLNPNNPEEDE